jgi:hypothetical protein
VAADPSELERAYADNVIGELRKDGRISIERAGVVAFPDSALVVIFRKHDRPGLYGVRERLLDENSDLEGVIATYSYLRWIEALDCGELPHLCSPDSTGVTWLNLWDDWS